MVGVVVAVGSSVAVGSGVELDVETAVAATAAVFVEPGSDVLNACGAVVEGPLVEVTASVFSGSAVELAGSDVSNGNEAAGIGSSVGASATTITAAGPPSSHSEL